MAQRAILEYPDPRLRRRAERVAVFDLDLEGLVDDLADTLRANGGIGLSAPQIGDLRRVLIADPSEGALPPRVYINPEIVSRSALGFVEESCLSVPGIVGNVIRATRIRVRAHDVKGEIFECDARGMDAVCLQHEMDHLEGKLFIDRLSVVRRLWMRVTGARSRMQGAGTESYAAGDSC